MSTFPNGATNAAPGPSSSALSVNPATDLNRLSPHPQPNGYAVHHAAPANGTVTVIVQDTGSSSNGEAAGPQPNFLFGYRKTGLAYSGHMKLHWRPDLPEDIDDVDKNSDDDGWEPERPARISAIWDRMRTAGLLDQAEHIAVRAATKEEIMLAHSEAHWQEIANTASFTQEELIDRLGFYGRLSLYVNQSTFFCARLAAGGVIETCRSVAEGRIRNGFAVVRPPGHHCEPEDPSGFCFFNNVAVATKWLQAVYPTKIKKVLIFDWDVHHGNGTQRSFYHDPNVLFISIHRYLDDNRQTYFYPGSDWGSPERVGEGEGRGFTVNIGWPEGAIGDNDYLYAMQRIVMPIAMEFSPDFVIVSAGYDAAYGDPLGKCNVSPECYAHMTYMLSSLANGKIVLALEGGYDLVALANSATECTKVLLGESPPQIPSMTASPVGTETVDECLRTQSKYWKTLPQYVARNEASATEGPIVPLAELLRMHRTYELYHKYELCTVPIADEILKASYDNQILSSMNVYTANTVVLFLHDLGNVRSEVPTAKADVSLEHTYLVDTNKIILDWVNAQEWGLIDVQVQPITGEEPRNSLERRPEEESRLSLRKRTIERLVDFVYQTFIQLADCENLVVIGLGEGCNAVHALVNKRLNVTAGSEKDIRTLLKATVLLPGLSQIPVIKQRKEQQWYKDLSLVLVPNTHAVLASAALDLRATMKHGNIRPAGHSRPTTILLKEFDSIAAHLLEKVGRAEKERERREMDEMAAMDGAVEEAARMRAAEQAAAAAAAIVSGAADVGGAVPMEGIV